LGTTQSSKPDYSSWIFNRYFVEMEQLDGIKTSFTVVTRLGPAKAVAIAMRTQLSTSRGNPLGFPLEVTVAEIESGATTLNDFDLGDPQEG
jgi:hypothetical protein